MRSAQQNASADKVNAGRTVKHLLSREPGGGEGRSGGPSGAVRRLKLPRCTCPDKFSHAKADVSFSRTLSGHVDLRRARKPMLRRVHASM